MSRSRLHSTGHLISWLCKIGDTETVEKMTKADQEQEELEKKMWEDEKEATAARLKKLNKDVEQNGKLLKEALDNMPSAGMKYWKSPESLHIATFGSGNIMAFPVMKFQDQGYKIRKIFA